MLSHRFLLTSTALIFAIVTCVGCTSEPSGAKSWSDHTQGLPFVMGYEAGLQQASSQGKPAMLFVTTTWCSWCKKLAKEAFNDAEIRQILTDKFVCVIIDGDTEREAVSTLGVDGYPHVVFHNTAGQKVDEVIGYVPAPEFRAHLDGVLQSSAAPQG